MNNNIDLNLTLDMDNYLLQFDSFNFIKLLMDEYQEKNSNIINYRNFNFESMYPKVSDFINVTSLEKNLDIEELYFISYIIYKLKGSTESVSKLLDFVKCKHTISITYDEDTGDRVLNLNLEYIEVLNPYLAERNLLRLCRDLLYFTKFSIKIEKLSIIYQIQGEINKTYYTVSSFYVESDKLITQEVSYDW